MIGTRVDLAREALEKSLEVREEAGTDYKSPINVIDLCGELVPSVRVLFVNYSMEGCYLRNDRPLIKISALRPLVRRAFNCAHELGHHVFGHGSTIDELQEESNLFNGNSPNEFLVNAFVGFLLMPKLGVRRAFTTRGWRATDPTPEQLYVISCHFGVGYTTLINHMAHGLRELSSSSAARLSAIRLPKIRRSLTGSDDLQRLQIIDQQYEMSIVDTEVGTHVILVPGAQVESDSVQFLRNVPCGRLFVTTHPGVFRATGPDGWAVIIRVSRYQYSGWSQYRHLGEEDD